LSPIFNHFQHYFTIGFHTKSLGTTYTLVIKHLFTCHVDNHVIFLQHGQTWTQLLKVSPLVMINMPCANLIDKGHIKTLLLHLSSFHNLYICNQLAPLQAQVILFLQMINDILHNYLDCPYIFIHPLFLIGHHLVKDLSFKE
jgi:hypothetical protein